MRKTEDLSYYLIERVKKNTGKKKSTFIIVRFINNSTGERKEVTLTKLRKLIGDKKRFMPSNTLEINRIVRIVLIGIIVQLLPCMGMTRYSFTF